MTAIKQSVKTEKKNKGKLMDFLKIDNALFIV